LKLDVNVNEDGDILLYLLSEMKYAKRFDSSLSLVLSALNIKFLIKVISNIPKSNYL